MVRLQSRLNVKYKFKQGTVTRQPTLQTLSYTPAQNTQTQYTQHGLTTNIFHSKTVPISITSGNLFRTPLRIIPNNYRLALRVQTPIIHNILQ